MSQDYFDVAAQAYVDSVGDEVTYNGEEMRAVFGSGWVSVQSGDVRISSRRPEIYVRLADLPDGAAAGQTPEGQPGDEVEIRGRTFEVVTVKPDAEEVGVDLVLKLAE